MSHTSIHPANLFGDKNPEELCILDVRTAAEVQSEALPGCIHIPLHELTPERLQAELEARGKTGDTLYLMCQSGRRAESAAQQLRGRIEAPLCVVEGGMNAVKQCNLPLQQSGRKVMSLERQVRIAAGSLVMIGVALGFLVNPGFFWLSGFVGAGLTFAGITDTCAMGMLIARMPWNK
jgi:rhodanese-related sulfurtransferase